MSLFTSSHFASASAAGTDWRDTSKNVLEKLDGVRTRENDFNFGFIYISDHLADDTTSILNLFKSVLKIDNWVGSIGMGVLGCKSSFVDQPAISAMIGRFEEDSFCIFPDIGEQQDIVTAWLSKNTPMLGVVHGDPMAEKDPQETLTDLSNVTDSFLVGGLSSSRKQHYQIANDIYQNSISGAFFADSVQVSTTLSQGCYPISELHTITKTDQNVILEIDDKPALDVLQEDLRKNFAQKQNKDIKELTEDLCNIETSDHIPPEFESLFQGKIHAALPFSQSDQKDYSVRSIAGVFADERSLAIADNVDVGRIVMFARRDEESAMEDLRSTLISLQERVIQERNAFEPKGALYISCIARGFSQNSIVEKTEIDLIHDVIGTLPMTGFYAGGEISNARLYGYTGVLVLFF